MDLETLLFELLQRSVNVKGVPKDDDVYDQSERSELIFLSFVISLAEFAPLSVEDSSGQFIGEREIPGGQFVRELPGASPMINESGLPPALNQS